MSQFILVHNLAELSYLSREVMMCHKTACLSIFPCLSSPCLLSPWQLRLDEHNKTYQIRLLKYSWSLQFSAFTFRSHRAILFTQKAPRASLRNTETNDVGSQKG